MNESEYCDECEAEVERLKLELDAWPNQRRAYEAEVERLMGERMRLMEEVERLRKERDRYKNSLWRGDR